MIKINNLVIEITRRCNLNCKHCIRGESQNKDIDVKYIDILLDQVESIGSFCPTGGETSLNIPAIEYFIEGCKKRNIKMNKFYIATNGIDIDIRFVNMCLELQKLCKYGNLCHVQISNDIYHNNEKMYDDTILKKLPFYSKKHVDGDTLENGKKMHREGRAKYNKSAKVLSGAIPVISTKVFDANPIYLTVDGEIVNGCDWSYDNQKKHFLCDVTEVEKLKNELK